jgi:peptide chain release factor 2
VSIFDLAGKQRQIEELEKETLDPDFWSDPTKAQATLQQIARLKSEVEPWVSLRLKATELSELIELCAAEKDDSLLAEIRSEVGNLSRKWEELHLTTLFSGEYDENNAIVSINSGAGGVEAMDWCEMLARMYLRWAENKGFTTEILEATPGDEAGLKSITFIVRGPKAYGHLRAERGVHRLVRISPFDANKRRHTSFASVDVVPEIAEDIEVEINPEDLRIDTYRASSAGGQHVQKNDSAVRITHIPTGIVVQCQNERSQYQNRMTAMKVLRARLFERELRERQNEIERIRGEQSEIGWGNQIRSYVFCPYTMVKDHRTEFETSNVQAVMDGEIDDFIRAYLEATANKEKKW